ncbi:MAG: hypothetical protein ACREPG_05055 [Candidatus Binatia bacterium]
MIPRTALPTDPKRVQFAGDARGDRRIGAHADQLRLETFLAEKPLLPRDVELDGRHAGARHADAEFLRCRLSARHWRSEAAKKNQSGNEFRS